MMGVSLISKTEVQNLLNQATVQPASDRIITIDRLISRLKSDGNWSLLDGLWITAAHDNQFGRLNWVNPGTYTATVTGSPVFTVDRGYLGVANGYLDTGWKPTNGVNFVQNSACIGMYSRNNVQAATPSIGCLDGSLIGTSINVRNSSDQFGGRVNSLQPTAISNTNSSALLYAYRVNSATINYGRNGSSLGSQSQTSTTPTALNVFICSANGSGAFDTTRQIAMGFVGSGSIDFTKLYNAVQEYMINIGANV